MRRLKTPGLEEATKTSGSLGVEMIGFTMSVGVLGISKEDFIDGVRQFAGAAT
jgi:peroxiredoxin family protein